MLLAIRLSQLEVSLILRDDTTLRPVARFSRRNLPPEEEIRDPLFISDRDLHLDRSAAFAVDVYKYV